MYEKSILRHISQNILQYVMYTYIFFTQDIFYTYQHGSMWSIAGHGSCMIGRKKAMGTEVLF